jgi:hypothetical protein
VLADRAHELGRVPLVHEHEIGTVERGVEIDVGGVVQLAPECRVGGPVRLDGVGAALRDEVRDAPRVARLEHGDREPAREQLGDDAAEEVRVAVVPVGAQGVHEEHDAPGAHAHAASRTRRA